MARISSGDNAATSWKVRIGVGARIERWTSRRGSLATTCLRKKIKTVKTVPFLPTKKVGWPSFRTIDPSPVPPKEKEKRERRKRRFIREGVNVKVITTDVKTRHDTLTLDLLVRFTRWS